MPSHAHRPRPRAGRPCRTSRPAAAALAALLAAVPLGPAALGAQDAAVKQAADEETAKIQASGKLSTDRLLNEYINGLGQRLVPKDAPAGMTFNFNVILDPTLNAFALPNGNIYVHSGILARLENEAQLATVLGHEITHVVKQHSLKGFQQEKKSRMLGAVAGTLIKQKAADIGYDKAKLLSYGGSLAMQASTSGYSRSLEDEADTYGLQYMFDAGYDPREAPKPFALLLKTYGDESKLENFFYGDHSRNQDRIDHLNGLVEHEYAAKLAGKTPLTNSTEFQRRTRVLVRENAVLDYKLKRYETAKAGLERVLQVTPNDAAAHFYLGNVYRESGRTDADLDKAIAEYQAALKANSLYAPAHRELGLAYYRKGSNKEALAALEQYLKLAPSAPDRADVEHYIDEIKSQE